MVIVVTLVEKRHYELKVRPVGDCKVIFSWSNRCASPQWENGLKHLSYIVSPSFRATYILHFFLLQIKENVFRMVCG
jgi:hypothetical protein